VVSKVFSRIHNNSSLKREYFVATGCKGKRKYKSKCKMIRMKKREALLHTQRRKKRKEGDAS
jgi:hypothetical protein